MYTTWLDALEEGDMAGVCMIDMSAAFDVVDTQLLLEKLWVWQEGYPVDLVLFDL